MCFVKYVLDKLVFIIVVLFQFPLKKPTNYYNTDNNGRIIRSTLSQIVHVDIMTSRNVFVNIIYHLSIGTRKNIL